MIKKTNEKVPILSTKEELKNFIKQTLENREKTNKRVIIGKINEEAQQRIEKLCGKKISDIDIDSSGIFHSITKVNHNIEPDDLLYAIDVINTTKDITLTNKKHQDCDVLIFRKNIDGEITFLTEAHIANNYLLVFNAWRQKKGSEEPRCYLKVPRGLRPKRTSACH